MSTAGEDDAHSSAFNLDPEIKRESVWTGSVLRPATLLADRGGPTVRVYERATATTQRVSVSSAGVEGNSASTGPSITPDGRYVAFTSDADNLVDGGENFDTDVFVQDRQTLSTVRASVRTDGTESGSELGSGGASISTDGQAVAFDSEGALVPEDLAEQATTEPLATAVPTDLSSRRTTPAAVGDRPTICRRRLKTRCCCGRGGSRWIRQLRARRGNGWRGRTAAAVTPSGISSAGRTARGRDRHICAASAAGP